MKKSELRQIIKEEISYVKELFVFEDKAELDGKIRDYLHDKYDSDPKVMGMLKQKGFVGQEIRDNKKADIKWLLSFAKRFNDKILAHLVKMFMASA